MTHVYSEQSTLVHDMYRSVAPTEWLGSIGRGLSCWDCWAIGWDKSGTLRPWGTLGCGRILKHKKRYMGLKVHHISIGEQRSKGFHSGCTDGDVRTSRSRQSLSFTPYTVERRVIRCRRTNDHSTSQTNGHAPSRRGPSRCFPGRAS